MYFPSAEYRLERIEKRRRYRRWMLATQLAMVFFFSDQILKTWVRGHYALGETSPLVGETIQVGPTVDKRVGETQLVAVPSARKASSMRLLAAAACVAIFAAAVLRRRSGTSELYGYGILIGAALSKCLDHWRYDYAFDTFLISMGWARGIPFCLADASLLLGFFLVTRSLLKGRSASLSLESLRA